MKKLLLAWYAENARDWTLCDEFTAQIATISLNISACESAVGPGRRTVFSAVALF